MIERLVEEGEEMYEEPPPSLTDDPNPYQELKDNVEKEKKQNEDDAREEKKHKHFASAERATVDAGILEMEQERVKKARRAHMDGNFARAKQIASKKGMTAELEEELVMYRVHPTHLMKEAGDSWNATCRKTK